MNDELLNGYKIVVTVSDWKEVEDWCIEHVGHWNIDWYKLGIDPLAHLSGDYTTTWYFKDEKNAMLFILRWT